MPDNSPAGTGRTTPSWPARWRSTAWLVPSLVLTICLLATAVWWNGERRDRLDSEGRRFAEISARIAARIDERMIMGEQIVVDIASIKAMQSDASEAIDWREYERRSPLSSRSACRCCGRGSAGNCRWRRRRCSSPPFTAGSPPVRSRCA